MLSSGVFAAATLWPLAIINFSSFLDSAWDVACIRAQRAGKLLATMLAGRAHGDRPVVLVGLSVGALLVYYCLLELYTLGARTLHNSVTAFFMEGELKPPCSPLQIHAQLHSSGEVSGYFSDTKLLCMLIQKLSSRFHDYPHVRKLKQAWAVQLW